MTDRIDEIRSFLAHHDNSLAARRLLDLSLDSGNEPILKETIRWSRTFRKETKEETASAAFYSEANGILEKLAPLTEGYQFAKHNLLHAANITKTYSSGNFSLQPISLEIKAGDILGVVGENGNGKTTLLRCLAGQLALDDGRLNYTQLVNPDHYSIKHHVAFIPQRIPKWYGQLKDNLHFAAAISGVTGRENDLMVEFMLERLNLTEYAHLNWSQISSGYRTRFEIARVLLQKPSLLILDEPLANLDINAQQTILTDLKYLAKSAHHPMGVILSSQQLHEVEKIADTVLFIKKGKCLFRTGDDNAKETSNVLEVETTATRENIIQILGDEVQVQFNGGFYTITSATQNSNEIISKLISSGVNISYFRDITHSTKRFFN
jgi:ABC-2 type transport system ATP-binding protein